MQKKLKGHSQETDALKFCAICSTFCFIWLYFVFYSSFAFFNSTNVFVVSWEIIFAQNNCKRKARRLIVLINLCLSDCTAHDFGNNYKHCVMYVHCTAFFNPIYRKKPAALNIFIVLSFKGQFKLFQRRLTVHFLANRSSNYTVKKVTDFPVPSLDVWLMTSRLGTGMSLTFFYSVF
jgi:hypothetical protein